jgi:hypothetical protein
MTSILSDFKIEAIQKLKKDIVYTPEEVFLLVGKACDAKTNPGLTNPRKLDKDIIRLVSNIASTSYTDYPEELKKAVARYGQIIKHGLSDIIAIKKGEFQSWNKEHTKDIITPGDIVYRIKYEDLPLVLNFGHCDFFIQWRFDINK